MFPISLHGIELHDYQEQGISWLIEAATTPGRQVRVIADDPGLGKTIQTLSLIRHLMDTDPNTRALIVCPSGLRGQWQQEIQRLMPDVSVAPWVEGGTEQITLITPGVLRRFIPQLLASDFALVVVDEVSEGKPTIDNHGGIHHSLNSRQIKKLTANIPLVVGLTATMQENSPAEPWAILDCLNTPGLPDWATYSTWLQWKRHKPNRYGAQRPPEARDYTTQGVTLTRQMLAPVVLRRTAEQVGLQLPERVGSRIKWVPLNAAQKAIYEQAGKLTAGRKMHRQAKAGLLHEGFSPVAHAAVTELAAQPRKAIIYSEYYEMLDATQDLLEQAGISYTRLDGSITSKPTMREKVLTEFGNPDGPQVLLGTRVVERGLNLQHANTLFSLDLSWNPGREDQRAGRIRRIGSPHQQFTHTVFMGDTPMSRAKYGTVDRKLRSAQRVGLA